MSAARRPTVSVIYPFFPHYRAPVMRALNASRLLDFQFWGSHSGANGIEPYSGETGLKIHKLQARMLPRTLRISGYREAVRGADIDAVVIHGAPNWPDTWVMALLARVSGKKVFFWSHGWLKKESKLKAAIRNLYFGLADRVLVYGDRAREIAAQSGFNAAKVVPIYNSLDTDCSERVFQTLDARGPADVRSDLDITHDEILIVCVARLTTACRFDLLIQALPDVDADGRRLKLVLLGDGPERESLEELAARLGQEVKFLGATYDESIIGKWLYCADLCVSPGKIGLSAMHSLAYGTPAFTHGDFDQQMPEFEAIIPGQTGAFFERDSVASLAATLSDWIKAKPEREQVRITCRALLFERYTPVKQKEFIEEAICTVLKQGA